MPFGTLVASSPRRPYVRVARGLTLGVRPRYASRKDMADADSEMYRRVVELLAPGEQLLAFEQNVTFHRFGHFALAVSDQALYLPRQGLGQITCMWGRGCFQRLPLGEITRVTLRRKRPGLRSVVGVLFLALGAGIAVRALREDPGFTWLFVAIPAALLLYGGYAVLREARGRHRLTVERRTSHTRIDSPPDDYADEKAYDYAMLQRFLAACRRAGIEDVRDVSIA